ncbi:MAG: SRPBCC domain-containing protein [Chloroflexota bacterium]
MKTTELVDNIERVLTLAVDRQRAWDAIGTPHGLSQWFSDRAEFEPVAGAKMRVEWDAYESVPAIVETVDPPREFAFRWIVYGARDTDQLTPQNSTLVTFTLEEVAEGTRITVRETGFASLPPELHGIAQPEHEGGWTHELQELVSLLTEDSA